MTSRLRSISGKVERSVRVAVIFKFTEVAILSTRILSQISRLTIWKETFGCICILYLDGREHLDVFVFCIWMEGNIWMYLYFVFGWKETF